MPPALCGVAHARVVHQDPSHKLRGYSKKVYPIVPMHHIPPCQAEICFMNQRRALQRMVATLTGQALPRQPAKFVIDQRKKCLPGADISVAPAYEQLGDLIGRL